WHASRPPHDQGRSRFARLLALGWTNRKVAVHSPNRVSRSWHHRRRCACHGGASSSPCPVDRTLRHSEVLPLSAFAPRRKTTDQPRECRSVYLGGISSQCLAVMQLARFGPMSEKG